MYNFVFVCSLDVFRPFREFFKHIQLSLLPVKGANVNLYITPIEHWVFFLACHNYHVINNSIVFTSSRLRSFPNTCHIYTRCWPFGSGTVTIHFNQLSFSWSGRNPQSLACDKCSKIYYLSNRGMCKNDSSNCLSKVKVHHIYNNLFVLCSRYGSCSVQSALEKSLDRWQSGIILQHS